MVAELGVGGLRRKPKERDSAEQLQVGDARQKGLDPTAVGEGHHYLLVAASQLGGHDDAVSKTGVTDAVAVAELPLPGDAGT